MDSQLLDLNTSGNRYTDISHVLDSFCEGREDGLCSIFVPHATAGLALIELGAGSDKDLNEVLDRLLPRDDRWVHRHGSPGHGADHVLPAFLSPSLTVPVIDGRAMLGTWQHVVFVDFNVDNPHRNVRFSFIDG